MSTVQDKLALLQSGQATIAARLDAVDLTDLPTLRDDLAALDAKLETVLAAVLNVQAAIG